jgi:hypothetical protein
MTQQSKSIADRVDEARQAELDGDTEGAIALYEENIKTGVPDQFSFDRLMVLYRKQKKYRDELRVINRGIKVFTEDHQRRQKTQIAEARNKKQVQELSNAIMKKAGLKDRKGNDVYLPGPLSKWIKRKEVVLKRMK